MLRIPVAMTSGTHEQGGCASFTGVEEFPGFLFLGIQKIRAYDIKRQKHCFEYNENFPLRSYGSGAP